MTGFANTPSGAIFSPCRKRRYLLWRNWHPGPMVRMVLDSPGYCRASGTYTVRDSWLLCIGLNPSKADEQRNDPTVSQMCGRAKRLGYTGLLMCNTSPHVSTDPAGMLAAEDHGYEENLLWIGRAVERASIIIAAWGNLVGERGVAVERILRESGKEVQVLGFTRSWNPRHPRGVSLAVEPRVWIEGRA